MRYRKKCLNKKGEQCTECGSEEEIEVHHIDGNRWNDGIDNLVPLCRECHLKVHSGDPEMKHWTEQIDREHYLGDPTEKEVNEAFEQAGLE